MCIRDRFSLVLLWMLSQLFMQQWWQGRRPILWISLPYIVIIVALIVDLVGRFGWFANGLNQDDGSTLHMTQPGGRILASLFTIGWIVQVAMLIAAFIQHRDARRPIFGLVITLTFTILVTQINARLNIIPSLLTGLITSIPILITLSYVVLRTSLLLSLIHILRTSHR